MIKLLLKYFGEDKMEEELKDMINPPFKLVSFEETDILSTKTKFTLGRQQVEILKRLYWNDDGFTSSQLLKGLSRQNRPEKKLEEIELIQNISVDDDKNEWYITDKGREEYEYRMNRHA